MGTWRKTGYRWKISWTMIRHLQKQCARHSNAHKSYYHSLAAVDPDTCQSYTTTGLPWHKDLATTFGTATVELERHLPIPDCSLPAMEVSHHYFSAGSFHRKWRYPWSTNWLPCHWRGPYFIWFYNRLCRSVYALDLNSCSSHSFHDSSGSPDDSRLPCHISSGFHPCHISEDPGAL